MSPRSVEQNEVVRAESRRRIIESALALFAEHGYEKTSIKMIAQHAGISQGLMYNYFAGKDELLKEIFAQSIADVRESFARAEATGDPSDRVVRLIRASFAVVQDNMAFWRLSYGVRTQSSVLALLGDDLLNWIAEIRRTLERYLQAAGHPQPALEAALLFALIDGVAQHYVLDPETYPLAEISERIVAMYV
jgi:AcrR family transcriptional regulator